MVQQKAKLVADQPPDAAVTVSLGKGAWDCDRNVAIPPEKEAEVFEEVATMEFPFEGIPTVPPRKDMDHMVFFCSGCRYRVTAYRDWTVAQVKQALWKGGIQRSNKPKGIGNTPGLQAWQDLVQPTPSCLYLPVRQLIFRASYTCALGAQTLSYAGQHMDNDKPLGYYHVPVGCQTLIAIETAKLSTKPDQESAYWN